MDVTYDDAEEAMLAVVTLKRFGLDAYSTGREIDPHDGDPPYMEWTVHAPQLGYGLDHAVERDEGDAIDTAWDRAAEDRAINATRRAGLPTGYKEYPTG